MADTQQLKSEIISAAIETGIELVEKTKDSVIELTKKIIDVANNQLDEVIKEHKDKVTETKKE